MTEYISVTPGIDMSQALNGARLTKKWLRDYLRDNPQKDFRMVGRSSYVNGEECIDHDLVLEVRRPGDLHLVAVATFQRTTANEWGYQAVVA